MELFWYNIRCTACRSLKELTFIPSGTGYADKYRDFANHMQDISWTNNAKGWREYCDYCKTETVHQLNNYAPPYSGVEH